MPIYDKTSLARKAQVLGFTRDSYEKMSRLTEILQFINSEQELKSLLALKGGTAINLTIFNLPRLSVDIDLDFTENFTREETQERRERINAVLGRYMTAEGYILRDKSKRSHALDSFVYSYTNAAGNLDNIKIETNYMLRCHALPTKESITQTSDAFTAFPIRTLNPIEIFASKIVALSSRAAARDLYDLNNMVKFGLFNETDLIKLRKCVVLYFAITGDKTTKGIDTTKITGITERAIKTELYPMIRNAERFDFATAKERVTAFLSDLLELTDKEKSFLQRFSKGRYEPQLLFEDEKIVARIEKHPMAIWRIRQIEDSRDTR